MIEYKSSLIELQFVTLEVENKQLYDMVIELHKFSMHYYNIPIVITSIYRSDNPDSVHAHWRGVDIRSWNYIDIELNTIKKFFNMRYKYDADRPEKEVLLVHDVGLGKHIHLQNHPNTKLLSSEEFFSEVLN